MVCAVCSAQTTNYMLPRPVPNQLYTFSHFVFAYKMVCLKAPRHAGEGESGPSKNKKKVSKSLVKKTKPSLLSVKRQMKEIAEDNMGTNVDVYFEVGCCL